MTINLHWVKKLDEHRDGTTTIHYHDGTLDVVQGGVAQMMNEYLPANPMW